MTTHTDILFAESLENDARTEETPAVDAPVDAPSPAPALDTSAFEIPFPTTDEAAEDDSLVGRYEDVEFGALDRSWATSKW